MALTWEPDPGSLQQIMILLDSEFRHEDPARTQASESNTHTDTTCTYTDFDHVVLETGGPEPIPRLQQLSRICLHKGTPLSPIVIWIVWRCMCVCR